MRPASGESGCRRRVHSGGQRRPLPLGRGAGYTGLGVFPEQRLRLHIKQTAEGLTGERVEGEPAGHRPIRALAIRAQSLGHLLGWLNTVRIRGVEPIGQDVDKIGEVTVASRFHQHLLRFDQLEMNPVIVELVQLPHMTFGQLAGSERFGEHGEVDQPPPELRQPPQHSRIGLRGRSHVVDGVAKPERFERAGTFDRIGCGSQRRTAQCLEPSRQPFQLTGPLGQRHSRQTCQRHRKRLLERFLQTSEVAARG